jgi:hypothetical protein
LSNQKKKGQKRKKENEFLSLFYSFGEIIHRIGLEHTNAKGTTSCRSVTETLPKKQIIFGQFCEFLIFGVFVCVSVLIFIIIFFNFFNFWLF